MNPQSLPSLRICSQDGLTPLPLRSLFGNDRPIQIDLGCGKGRFLLAHAQAHPDINFLGVDRMLRRIRKVDRKAVRAGLTHVRLLRMEAYYAVAHLIPEACIDTYFILFPDPWPKGKHQRHRLFNPSFIDALYRTLTPGGRLHVATDHRPYFEEIHAALAAAGDRFAPIPAWAPKEHERTDFELLFLGRKTIGRASFIKRNPGPAGRWVDGRHEPEG
jgi:tRNA (guanine-N7-)-methyltransferase